MTKLFKRLFTSFLFVLVALVATAVLQANANPLGRGGSGTVTAPAQAAITKFLQMPVGTTTPEARFTFDVVFRETLNGTAPTAFPATPVHLDIPANAPELSNEDRAALELSAAADVKIVEATTPDLLAGVTWAGAGEFLFTVTERADTNVLPFLSDYTEEIIYDTSTTYTLFVRVVADSETGDLYVESTWAWRGSGPDFTDDESDVNTGKLDPDPNRPGGGNRSEVSFLNTFIRRTEDDIPEEIPGGESPGGTTPDDGGPGDPGIPSLDNAFIVSKRVGGQLSSINSAFDFNVTVTNPTLASDTIIRAWIYSNVAGTFVRGSEVLFTSGVARSDIALNHGQSLVFEPLAIGTIVEATEVNPAPYTPTLHLTLGGVGIGNASGTPAAGVGTNNIAEAPHRLGEGDNVADFININASIPITGLIMNNLPLILVSTATVGFFAVVVARKKRRAYE